MVELNAAFRLGFQLRFLDRGAGDNFFWVALPITLREFLVGELAIAIVGIVEVMPTSLAQIHAVERPNEPAPRNDIGSYKRDRLVGAFHELGAGRVLDEPWLEAKITELLCDDGIQPLQRRKRVFAQGMVSVRIEMDGSVAKLAEQEKFCTDTIHQDLPVGQNGDGERPVVEGVLAIHLAVMLGGFETVTQVQYEVVQNALPERAGRDQGRVIEAGDKGPAGLLVELIVIREQRHRFRAEVRHIPDDVVDLCRAVSLLEPLDRLCPILPVILLDRFVPVLFRFGEAQGRGVKIKRKGMVAAKPTIGEIRMSAMLIDPAGQIGDCPAHRPY